VSAHLTEWQYNSFFGGVITPQGLGETVGGDGRAPTYLITLHHIHSFAVSKLFIFTHVGCERDTRLLVRALSVSSRYQSPFTAPPVL